MHYVHHILQATRKLGPLRYTSARPMERAIGIIKNNIKSRQNPSENAFNFIKDHFALSQKNQKSALTPDPATVLKNSKAKQLNNQEHISVIGIDRVVEIQSYFPSRTGQKICILANKINSIVYKSSDHHNDMEFVEGEVVGIKYGFLQQLYMDGGSNYALIETVHPIKRDKTSGCAYYDRAEHRKRLNRIRLSDTISLEIEVPSIYKEHPTRINISWKH